MKKNRMMRLASLLLVCVLLTTSVISGTFAKYTTAKTVNDSARVAKFGVTIEATGDIFAYEYATDDGIYSGVVAKSVIGESNADVIAPGTSGSFIDINIEGKPEVAVKTSYVATVELNDRWDISGKLYCPIIVTVKGNAYLKIINGLDYETATDFASAIKTAIDGYTQVYAPGDDLDNTDELVIDWEWPFENSTGEKMLQNDEADTLLGNRAADGKAGTISIEVKTTVEQID